MLFSAFKYNSVFWPPALVAQVGNLVLYKSKFRHGLGSIFSDPSALDHEFGGHFAGLDNPPALIADLKEIVQYWE
jgi:hypothetical protein